MLHIYFKENKKKHTERLSPLKDDIYCLFLEEVLLFALTGFSPASLARPSCCFRSSLLASRRVACRRAFCRSGCRHSDDDCFCLVGLFFRRERLWRSACGSDRDSLSFPAALCVVCCCFLFVLLIGPRFISLSAAFSRIRLSTFWFGVISFFFY